MYQILTGDIFDRRLIDHRCRMSILKRNPNPNIPTIKRKDKLHQRYHFIAKKKKLSSPSSSSSSFIIVHNTKSSYLNAAWTQRSRWYWTTGSCDSPGTASSLTIPWTRGSFQDLVTVRPFSVFFQHCTRTRKTEIDLPSPSPQLSVHTRSRRW